ncbi:ATP-grasp domain-containing protein [Phytoactinopolyspora halotolerans]|uniref:ATP-grasp domain-containing protein n=1 Tax=Phytoactinopolyspora halotolerans TaxID=1981512 RepID=A0A6L9S6U4_9ACTN|nr:hypothetical protein [Phytoactinopolyspora halotolerans]NEE01185.1 hypothetical protein [Phytoactinopolyspora halotolerans]
MTVLLATHRRATEIDRVIDELNARKIRFCRVNMAPGEGAFSAQLSNGRAKVTLSTDGGQFAIDEFTHGWYHQPALVEPKQISACKGASGEQAVLTSFSNGWEAVLEMAPVVWLNDARSVAEGSNKLRQLLAAVEVGLPVPTTVVGNLLSPAQRWLRGLPVVAKNLTSPHQVWNTERTVSFVTKRTDLGNIGEHALAAVPVILQHEVRPLREHRVVVVCDQVFSAAIPIDKRHGHVDVRLAPDSLRQYSKSLIEPTVKDQLIELMRRFKLNYCSADLIESDDGAWSFLELNTCGAWWWIDDIHAGSVTHALTDFLSG